NAHGPETGGRRHLASLHRNQAVAAGALLLLRWPGDGFRWLVEWRFGMAGLGCYRVDELPHHHRSRAGVRVLTVSAAQREQSDDRGQECNHAERDQRVGRCLHQDENRCHHCAPDLVRGFEAAAHDALGSSDFLLLGFPGEELPSVLWQESITSTVLTADAVTIREHSIALAGATSAALSREESFELVRKATSNL
ncbi:Scr1 family TA system antitoxin-like transcriptional regulator, partial [Saccharopolyspora kobensis]